jgi:RNA polymerase sigma-70 factor (ECF subfamily)
MASFHKMSDEELVERMSRSAQAAFAEIYRRYAGKLAGFAGSKLYNLDDAKDILQDIFVKLWENREQLVITSSLQSYLYTIVRHRVVDKIRKNITREEYASVARSFEAFHTESPEQITELRELKATINHSVDEMSPRLREIYKLSREQGLSNSEIASKLSLSEQTVKNQLSTALKLLRQDLGGLGAGILLIATLFKNW